MILDNVRINPDIADDLFDPPPSQPKSKTP
jgi:hypothetical protein